MFKTLKNLFGSENERFIKSLQNDVDQINLLEAKYSLLSDQDLAAQTTYLKKLLSDGKTLDGILCDAFAIVREASKRTIKLRHFDVQLIGGIILHKGMIAEMRTGEGKTLVSTLPTYLNALTQKGVHIVTVNDYLAKRDSTEMGKIYEFLGMSVGCITNNSSDYQRKEAYNSDIVYGTNNEFGFDYLRDNMKFSSSHMVQRPFNYAIIDEVDSVLIDEARTPLIISGPTDDNSDLYIKIDSIIPQLSDSDYEIDEKVRSIILTDSGIENIEKLLNKNNILPDNVSLYDIDSINVVHHVNQALRAHKLFSSNIHYMVKDGKVLIIDEFTGRMMDGRRYSEGLHQALEAKERVFIHNENQTLASITFQNYFRLYPKLSGMTGTAMTEANEFREIYNLNVIDVPTNQPIRRIDDNDEIYKSSREKYGAIVKVIEESHKNGQPILVGTISIEKSEHVSSLLKAVNIPHNVLNAKYHEKEAEIIAQAGRFNAVTIATNMAGRGTDIMLGGNPNMLISQLKQNLNDDEFQKEVTKINQQVEEEKKKVIEAGGLLVLATERHESRRIDNQLRGRSARQGDPGRSKFYLSLEDDLMRIFGSDKIANMLTKFGFEEGEAIVHPLINKVLMNAQQKVESYNYDIRKNLLKYDDVMNEQRKIIYLQRIEIMNSENINDNIYDMYAQVIHDLANVHISKQSYSETWNLESFRDDLKKIFNINLDLANKTYEQNLMKEGIISLITSNVEELFVKKEGELGVEFMNEISKKLLLSTLDHCWKDHLYMLDNLRQGINLRAYGQKNPLNEYKREAFYMFKSMLKNLRFEYIEKLANFETNQSDFDRDLSETSDFNSLIKDFENNIILCNNDKNDVDHNNIYSKIGRNDLCLCGSNKKFKHCHGKYQ